MKIESLLIMVALFFVTASAGADDSRRHQQVDGMDAYLGVIPAQITRSQHPKMQGGIGGEEHQYHILIALFDSGSGEGISDAKVKATVAQLGMTGDTGALEPMPTEFLSYGNYFSMHKADYYRIKVEI